MLEPLDVEITLQSGAVKTFVLTKFPAVAGREIIAKYPTSNVPKIGDYGVSEETMLKLMAHVGVRQDSGNVLMLTTRALVDNHCVDWETLAKLEWGAIEYNCSFFKKGPNSDFLGTLAQKLPASISRMLTDLLAQLSEAGKPPSGS